MWCNISAAETLSYSLLYEKDGKGAMLIYYEDNLLFGQIIQFGGYKWFRLTYSNADVETTSFVQPSNLGVPGNLESWMVERYAIDKMEYQFIESEQDQILKFFSPQATQEIIGYLSRNESFSFSTLSKNAWYAGTFIPIKTIKDFRKLAKLNSRTFCQLVNYKNIENKKNIELNTYNLIQDLKHRNLKCDKNFNLIR